MNNIAKRFSRSEFIKLLHTTNVNPNNIDNQRLSLAYTRFINRIQTVSKLDSCSRLEALQALARTRELCKHWRGREKFFFAFSHNIRIRSLSAINWSTPRSRWSILRNKWSVCNSNILGFGICILRVLIRLLKFQGDLPIPTWWRWSPPCRLWFFSASRMILRPPSCRLRASLRRSAIRVSRTRTTAAGPSWIARTAWPTSSIRCGARWLS